MLTMPVLQALRSPFLPQPSALDEALMLGQQPMQPEYQPSGEQAGMSGGGGGGSTSSRNLANFNFGNVKTVGGGWAQYADRISGAMGVGERALRYSNAPERGWHAETLEDFTNIYAPRSDKNDPTVYARFLGQRMGINPRAKINFRDRYVLAGIIKNVPDMEHGNGKAKITDAEAWEAAGRLLAGERPRMASAPDSAKRIISGWGYR